MRGVNKVIIAGTVGKTPTLTTFENGGSLARMSLATSEVWLDKRTNERVERTEWHNVVLHNRLAEIACQYITKGAKIYVEGSLSTKQWTDRDNQTRITTEIKASTMQMLSSQSNNNHGQAKYNTR